MNRDLLLPLFAAAALATACHAQTLVTLPTQATNASGDATNAFPWGTPASTWPGLRVLATYGTGSTGLTTPVVITELRWRPDEIAPPQPGGTFSTATIRMSTSPVGWQNVTTDFASDHGGDLTTVYSGPVTYTPTGGPTTWTPSSWCVRVQLQTPFVYYPTLGDLVIDVDYAGTSFAGGGVGTMDMQTANANGSRVFASSNYPTANNLGQTNIPVVQLVTYPAIASVASAGAGCVPIGINNDSFYQYFSGAVLVQTPPNLRMRTNGQGYRVDNLPAPWRSTTGALPLNVLHNQEIAVPFASGWFLDGFYRQVSTLYVAANGSVSTGPNGGNFSARNLLDSPYSSWFCWKNYDPSRLGSGSILWEETATHVYVTWDHVFGISGNGPASSFQLQFEKASANVDLVWGDRPGDNDFYTVGYSEGGVSSPLATMQIVPTSQLGFFVGFRKQPLTLGLPVRPVLGHTLQFTVANMVGTSPFGVVLVGLQAYASPIVLPGGGSCTQAVSSDAMLAFVPTGSQATVPMFLPGNPNYSGLQLHTQAMVLSPGSNGANLMTSNRLDLVLGVR